MKNVQFRLLFIILATLLLNSCYKEHITYPEHKNNMFNFLMSSEAETEVLDSRGRQFYIEPVPEMFYGEQQYVLDTMKIRGQSALNFQRKSYSVRLDKRIYLPTESEPYKDFKKFKLISLVFDYTYIENRLSHLLLNEIGLWPLHTFFTEVMLNNHHQGLYLFIEDPESNLFESENVEVVLRRYYHNVVSGIKLNTAIPTETEDYYISQFNSIYKIILDYSGEQLFNELSRHLNIQNYMRKMAFDYIILNGDYTDEVFFYAQTIAGNTYFDILPWDYDDIFSNIQHEVGRAWAVGKVFGERLYYSRDDVLADLNGRLIFSIEDDLDYIIAKDDFLYQKYLIELDYVLKKVTSTKIESFFESVNSELLPFYQKTEIIEQSEYDANPTSLELFTTNIINKEAFLLDRIIWISNELSLQ